MECKCTAKFRKDKEWCGRINRYIMECKLTFISSNIFLIIELIDTLWNVNSKTSKQTSLTNRINRYIMECKLNLLLVLIQTQFELIDTLWNVNNAHTNDIAYAITN